MGSKYPYTMLVVLAVLCILVGWAARGITENTKGLNKSMAWGYEEKKDVWNRIRVDENGYVICREAVK